MAHTAPDWSWMGKVATVFPVRDMAELARRIRCPISIDGRGNVLWFDDFEGGLDRWYPSTVGTGAAVGYSAESPHSGAYCCKLTAGSDSSRYALVYHRQKRPLFSAIGLELSFTLHTYTENFVVVLYIYDGSYAYYSRAIYYPATDKWRYYSSLGTWVDLLTGVDLRVGYGVYHTIKLVVDFENAEYVRFLQNETEVDLSGVACRKVADTTVPHFHVEIQNTGLVGHNPDTYIDDVILTQNES